MMVMGAGNGSRHRGSGRRAGAHNNQPTNDSDGGRNGIRGGNSGNGCRSGSGSGNGGNDGNGNGLPMVPYAHPLHIK
jgi:hypothetical protein